MHSSTFKRDKNTHTSSHKIKHSCIPRIREVWGKGRNKQFLTTKEKQPASFFLKRREALSYNKKAYFHEAVLDTGVRAV